MFSSELYELIKTCRLERTPDDEEYSEVMTSIIRHLLFEKQYEEAIHVYEKSLELGIPPTVHLLQALQTEAWMREDQEAVTFFTNQLIKNGYPPLDPDITDKDFYDLTIKWMDGTLDKQQAVLQVTQKISHLAFMSDYAISTTLFILSRASSIDRALAWWRHFRNSATTDSAYWDEGEVFGELTGNMLLDLAQRGTCLSTKSCILFLTFFF